MTGPTREEVERLCQAIIRHVADGAVIRQDDYASMIDTMGAIAALRERLEAAERSARIKHDMLVDCDMKRASARREADELHAILDRRNAEAVELHRQITDARAREAAAWEAVEPIRSLIELTECGEISGLHWTDEFGLFLLGDDDEPVYCAIKLTFEQLGKIAPTAPPDATAALTAVKDAEWNAAIEAAAGAVFEPEASEIRALRRNPKEGV